MRFLKLAATVSIIAAGMCTELRAVQADDPIRKLGAFLGKWDAQTSTGASSKIECRWSPQGSYLICEQQVSDSFGEHRQLTVYGYDNKKKNYVYSSLGDLGTPPSQGTMEIKEAIWTNSTTVNYASRTILMKSTYDFSSPGLQKTKVERSDDGGGHWQTVLEGIAKKTGN